MRLFLSRLILDPRSRQVWSELAHPYEMHRTLMRAFPRATDETKCKARDEYGVLFRADAGDDSREEIKVYVQSLVEPDWSFLSNIPRYLLVNAGTRNPDWQEVSRFYDNLKEGQVLSFRLRANPTKRIAQVTKCDSELKGKRVGILSEPDQLAWLVRKSLEREKDKPGGFEVLAEEAVDRTGAPVQVPRINIRPEGKRTGRKKEGMDSRNMVHLAVVFDGLLRITDSAAFRETLTAGIGSAKAYGFGLLSLAPRRV